MATFEEAIKIFVVSKTDFTNVVGDKIFPDVIPKSIKLPAVSYKLISSIESEVMSGNDYWIESTYQFDISSNTKTEAIRIINIIKKIFRNLKNNDFNGYKLQGVKTLGKLPSEYNDNIYMEKMDFKFFHDYIEI